MPAIPDPGRRCRMLQLAVAIFEIGFEVTDVADEFSVVKTGRQDFVSVGSR